MAKVPPPSGDPNAPLKALIFDSWYDSYQGVIVLVRVMDGQFKKGDRIKLMASGRSYEILRTGVFTPHMVEMNGFDFIFFSCLQMQIPCFAVDEGELENLVPEFSLHMNDIHAAGNRKAALVHEIPSFERRSIIMRNSLDQNAGKRKDTHGTLLR